MAIDRNLEQAFRNTTFRVFTPVPLDLRIGASSARMEALLRARHASTATFVTAFNPYGRAAPRLRNLHAQQRLVRELRRRGLKFLRGAGIPDDSNWQLEPSLLVLGLSRVRADRLAAKYRQAAHVWIERRKMPVLIFPKAQETRC